MDVPFGLTLMLLSFQWNLKKKTAKKQANNNKNSRMAKETAQKIYTIFFIQKRER